MIKEDESDQNFEVNFNEHLEVTEFQINVDHIKEERKKNQVLKLMEEHRHIFAKDKFHVSQVTCREAEIKLIRDEYVNSRAYKCSTPDE